MERKIVSASVEQVFFLFQSLAIKERNTKFYPRTLEFLRMRPKTDYCFCFNVTPKRVKVVLWASSFFLNSHKEVAWHRVWCSILAVGDKWALMELSFTLVTTKTWAHSRRFGFFRTFLAAQIQPPLVKSHFENTMEINLFNLREWRYHLVMKTIVGGTKQTRWNQLKNHQKHENQQSYQNSEK